jgi:hypothetical protein
MNSSYDLAAGLRSLSINRNVEDAKPILLFDCRESSRTLMIVSGQMQTLRD